MTPQSVCLTVLFLFLGFVSGLVPNCSNAHTHCFGPSQEFTVLQEAFNIPKGPGDKVYLEGGIHFINEVVVYDSGVSGAPIEILPFPTHNVVLIHNCSSEGDRMLQIVGHHWLTFSSGEGTLTFKACDSSTLSTNMIYVYDGCKGIVFDGVSFRTQDNCHTDQIHPRFFNLRRVGGVLFENCLFDNTPCEGSNPVYSYDQNIEPSSAWGSMKRVWFRNNAVSMSAGSSICISGNGDVTVENSYFHRFPAISGSHFFVVRELHRTSSPGVLIQNNIFNSDGNAIHLKPNSGDEYMNDTFIQNNIIECQTQNDGYVILIDQEKIDGLEIDNNYFRGNCTRKNSFVHSDSPGIFFPKNSFFRHNRYDVAVELTNKMAIITSDNEVASFTLRGGDKPFPHYLPEEQLNGTYESNTPKYDLQGNVRLHPLTVGPLQYYEPIDCDITTIHCFGPNQEFTVLQTAIDAIVGAGDIVYIEGGFHEVNEITILNSGTPGNPIVVQPFPGEDVVFKHDCQGSHEAIFNIPTDWITFTSGHGSLTFKMCNVDNYPTQIFKIIKTGVFGPAGVVIDGIKFQTGTQCHSVNPEYSRFIYLNQVRGVKIQNCVFDHRTCQLSLGIFSIDVTQTPPTAWGAFKRIVFKGNKVYHTAGMFFLIRGNADMTIENNYFHREYSIKGDFFISREQVIDNGPGMIVANNFFDSNGKAIHFTYDFNTCCKDNFIQNNLFDCAAFAGEAPKSGVILIEHLNMTRLLIDNNYFHGKCADTNTPIAIYFKYPGEYRNSRIAYNRKDVDLGVFTNAEDSVVELDNMFESLYVSGGEKPIPYYLPTVELEGTHVAETPTLDYLGRLRSPVLTVGPLQFVETYPTVEETIIETDTIADTGEIISDTFSNEDTLAIFPEETSEELADTSNHHVTDFPLVAVIGGVIAGVVVLIVLVILIIVTICVVVCLRRKANKDKNKERKSKMKIDELERTGGFDEKSIAKLKINESLFEIEFKDLEVDSKIGSGGSDALIFLAKWRKNVVAFKCFKLQDFLTEEGSLFKEFEKEVQILASTAHPNILRFFGACLSPPRVGIVMEYCENGDMKNFLIKYKVDNNELYDFNEKIRMLAEVASAMGYLHSKRILHRDLKCENVLVDSHYSAKLMDFGLSKMVENVSRTKTKRVGTSQYMSPEMVRGDDYDCPADVFSFAIGKSNDLMCFEALTNNFDPYSLKKKATFNLEFKVASNPEFRPPINKAKVFNNFKWLKEAIVRSWSDNPKARPSFDNFEQLLKSNGAKGMDEGTADEGSANQKKIVM